MESDTGNERPLSMRLDLYLERDPVAGRVRTDHGADERFVGWLGFLDAVQRLHEARHSRSPNQREEQCCAKPPQAS